MLLAAVVAVTVAGGAVAGATPPPDDAPDNERLERITAFNRELVESNLLPNSSTLVYHHGREVQFDVAGYADAARQEPATRDGLYRMYSMTKAITATAVMTLVEEGKVRLDDPVSAYLPSFADQKVQQADGSLVPAARPVNLRDLLTHTSGTVGLTEALTTPGLVQLDATTPMATLVDRIAALPLRSQPGTAYEYGFGLDIAGVVVEVVTGQTLEEALHERVFVPLGMHDTSFYVQPGDEDRLVQEQGPAPATDGTWSWVALPSAIYSSDKVGSARQHFGGGGWGGGVVSTIDDYARFARMLAGEGELDGVRVLSRKSVELMTTNHTGTLATNGGPGYGHGFGMGVRLDLTSNPTLGTVGQFGWSGAGFTTFWVDPTEDLVAVRFTNVLGADQLPGFGRISPTFANLVYQTITD
ncbi:MAG: serine hydrolase domain-containing protein [Acidimicrobiia bacterium]